MEVKSCSHMQRFVTKSNQPPSSIAIHYKYQNQTNFLSSTEDIRRAYIGTTTDRSRVKILDENKMLSGVKKRRGKNEILKARFVWR